MVALYVGWHRVQDEITVNQSGVKTIFEGLDGFEVIVFYAFMADERCHFVADRR
jgi:hypothetical protein